MSPTEILDRIEAPKPAQTFEDFSKILDGLDSPEVETTPDIHTVLLQYARTVKASPDMKAQHQQWIVKISKERPNDARCPEGKPWKSVDGTNDGALQKAYWANMIKSYLK